MKLIDKIKKEVPYLAAYAWLHNAALREGSDREACIMTIALMRIIHKIEALGATVQCYGSPEINYFDIEINGRAVMSAAIKELVYDSKQFLNSAFSYAKHYNIAPKGEKEELMREFRYAQKAYQQYCDEEQYLVPYMTMDGMIEALDTENGIWVWDYEEKEFKLEA